jgi:hypothetical protein
MVSQFVYDGIERSSRKFERCNFHCGPYTVNG